MNPLMELLKSQQILLKLLYRKIQMKHKRKKGQSEDQKKQTGKNLIKNINSANPLECLVCSETTAEKVTLQPCNHKLACADCSSRMKKCLQCGVSINKRVTKDGLIIPIKEQLHLSDERTVYLESKIAQIEESQICNICMDEKKNVVFLCGHTACLTCADTLTTCHMCRKSITKKIPIY